MPLTGQVRVFRRSRSIAPLPFPESVEQIITAIQSVFGSDGRRTLGCRFSDPANWEVKPRGEFPRIRHRAKFRDLAAFNFQPQNIVANPNVLFYKADTVEHRVKLRSILPYVLGALSSETLAQRHELQRLQRELRRKETDLRNIQTLSERWRATIDARVSEARDIGLIPSDSPTPGSQSAAMELLRGIAATFNSDPLVTSSTVSEGVTELNRLNVEEQGTAQELSRLRRRSAEMEQLRQSSSSYQGSVVLPARSAPTEPLVDRPAY